MKKTKEYESLVMDLKSKNVAAGKPAEGTKKNNPFALAHYIINQKKAKR